METPILPGTEVYLQYQAGESRWGSPPPALMQLEGECSNTPNCSPTPGGQGIKQLKTRAGLQPNQAHPRILPTRHPRPRRKPAFSQVFTWGPTLWSVPIRNQCPCRLRSGSRAEWASGCHYQDVTIRMNQGSMLCPTPIQTNVCPHTPGSRWTEEVISSHASHLILQ